MYTNNGRNQTQGALWNPLIFLAGSLELPLSGGLCLGGYYSVACLEVVGVHLIILVTTALSVAWLVGSSALRYHQLSPPQPCRPALGLQLKDPARPRLLGVGRGLALSPSSSSHTCLHSHLSPSQCGPTHRHGVLWGPEPPAQVSRSV